jgi:hypothetical protein
LSFAARRDLEGIQPELGLIALDETERLGAPSRQVDRDSWRLDAQLRDHAREKELAGVVGGDEAYGAAGGAGQEGWSRPGGIHLLQDRDGEGAQ